MSLDLFERETEERLDGMVPIQRPETGAWDGFARGTGMTMMQGFAKAARSVSMVGAIPPIAYDAMTTGTTMQDRYFRAHESIFQNAVDHWTPTLGEVGIAGQVTGSLLALLPLVIASPVGAVATTQLSVAEDLVAKGVDSTKAQAVGAAYGAGVGLGIWVPILGRTLPQRMLIGGAGFNVSQGIAMRGVAGEILQGTPAEGDFKPFAAEDLAIDAILGLAFGGLAHLSPAARAQGEEFWQRVDAWRKNLTPEQIEALAALRHAQHAAVDSFPGKPATPESVDAHVQRVRAAVEQLATDQPVNVTALPPVKATPDPARMEAAAARATELGEIARTTRIEEGLPPPPEVSRGTGRFAEVNRAAPEEQPRAIGRAVEQALLDMQLPETEARANASLWEAFFRSASDRYAIPAARILEQYGLDIRRLGEQEDLPGALAQQSAELTRRFDEAKAQAETARTEARQAQADLAALKAEGAPEAEVTAAAARWKQAREAASKRELQTRELRRELEQTRTMERTDIFQQSERTLFQSLPGQPRFYSELQRSLEGVKQESASPEQWKGLLKNLKGVKRDEIQWSGLEEWLDLQQGITKEKVTKQEVLDFLAGNAVRVEEVVLGQRIGEGGARSELRSPTDDEIVNDVALLREQGFIVDQSPDGTIWGVVDPEGDIYTSADMVHPDVRRDMPRVASAIDRVTDYLNEIVEGVPAGQPKHATYQLPGGENYRELLITLPGGMSELEAQRLPNLQELARRGALTSAEKAELTRLESMRQDHIQYTAGHFDEPNVLAHIRFNERTDAEGKRVLFVEELQSDWAQQGRKQGFAGGRRIERVNEEINRVMEELYTREEANGIDRNNAILDHHPDLQRRYESLITEMGRAQHGVPEAPFVEKTDAWVGLALKRMIAWAVENGFDRVAWTRGEQQVERWTSALRKHVDAIEWTKTEKGVQLVGYKGKARMEPLELDSPLYGGLSARQIARGMIDGTRDLADLRQEYPDLNLTQDLVDVGRMSGFQDLTEMILERAKKAQARTANRGQKVVDTTQREDELSDAIGKAMADKILKDPAQTGSIEGEGIRVDDTGMHGFYDRILPRVANEVLKKLGGGKVEEIQIGERLTDAERADSYTREHPGAGYPGEQPGFDITTEMIEKAKKGLPLFQAGRGQIQFGDRQTVIGLFENADASTFAHETGHFFLQATRDLASRATAPEQAVKDWGTLANWLKIEGGEITREQHEQFARGFERYLAEGKAPNEGLRGVFEQFRKWLLDIYHSLTELDVTLSDDVRAVMDRMLAFQKAEGPAGQAPNVPPPPRRAGAQPAGSAAPLPREAEPSALLRDIRELGGINRDQLEEITGEKRFGKMKGLPWGVFRAQGKNAVGNITEGHGLDQIGRELRERGWDIPEGEEVTVLTDLIRREIEGARAVRMGEEAEVMTAADIMANMDEIHAQFTDAEAQAAEKFNFNDKDPRYQAQIADIRVKRDKAMQEAMAEAEYPLQAEAARVAREKPNLRIRTGEDAEGRPVTMPVREFLEDAARASARAAGDAELFKVAASCLEGAT